MKGSVRIKYCPKCGWLLRASWMAQELLTTFSNEIKELTLAPSDVGVFDIEVDDRLVWSRKKQNGFPQIKELKKIVRDVLSPEMDLGHIDE